MNSQYYRQGIPDLNLSIERATFNVPKDGRYHIVKESNIIANFKSLKQAQEFYWKIVHDLGYKPKTEPNQKSAAELAIERHLDAKGLYWAESHKYREHGGKGGRGGV